ncbi:hypothetical protein BDV18DRAFT_159572 [Aspergillus unguis]
MPSQPEPRRKPFFPVLVDTPTERHTGPLIPSHLQNLFTSLAGPTSLPPLNTNIPIHFNKDKLALSEYIRKRLMEDLVIALQKCYSTVGPAVRAVQALHREKDERYRHLCPINHDRYRFRLHTKSIYRLRAWKENYASRTMYNDGPALAPTAKIPRSVMYLHCSREAYQSWAREYTAGLNTFYNGRYQAYRTAVAEFEEALSATKKGETMYRYSQIVLEDVQRYWEENFLEEMRKWEEFVPGLELPGYDVVVGEVYRAVEECVEGEEEAWNV